MKRGAEELLCTAVFKIHYPKLLQHFNFVYSFCILFATLQT